MEVYADGEALSLAAARLFAGQARRAVARRGRFKVLLSGGQTPRRCYQLLGEEPLAGTVPWQKVEFFWGDERCLPHGHPLSNFGTARRTFLDRLPIGEPQIHPVPYARTPGESAAAYERELREQFGDAPPRFDLALLGLGEDGHTASLFPFTAALGELRRLACEVCVPGQDFCRVTVTLPVLNRSALVVFLVSGSGKADVLRRVLAGEYCPERLPAQLIDPAGGRLLWLIDREAATLLPASLPGASYRLKYRVEP